MGINLHLGPTSPSRRRTVKIYMREAQRARLHRLADSINDTARMARTSLSLVLLVALYLGLTLVASTDENLLLNGQVTLPQAGVGISVVQSYIFAPPIFFYLHIQLLFLLSVLARKVRTFEAALKEEFPDAFLPILQNKVEAKREECWEWLSAFAFVQLFRRTPGMPRVLKLGARTLARFGIEAVPLALLFVIDISFVRYQSAGITWSHHCIFILDLVSIVIFNRLVFLGRDRIWGSASVSVAVPGKAGVPPAFGMGQRPAISGRTSRLMPYRTWWILVRSAKVMPAWLWISVRGTVAMGMVFLLIYAARPPQFHPQEVENDRERIWGERGKMVKDNQRSIWRERCRKFRQAIWNNRANPLDAGPCDWWGFGCRYLDVSNKWLLGAQPEDLPEDLVGPIPDDIIPDAFGDIRRFRLDSPDLARRKLRFARFGSVYLQGVDFQQAELQGANLQGAELEGANFQGAALQGSKGQPGSWFLTWMPDVSFDFSDSPEQYLQELLSDGIKDIELAWEEGRTLERHLEQSLSGDSEAFDGAEPEDKDMVFHTRKDKKWPAAPDITSGDYWMAWTIWTVDFACKNEHTARSSLQRWGSRRWFWPTDKFHPASLRPLPPKQAREKIQNAILEALERPECPGLHALTEDEWKGFVDR